MIAAQYVASAPADGSTVFGAENGALIDIAARVSDVPKSVAARNYQELMPIFNPTGRFNPKALDVLSRSFVELGLLPDAPDMGRLYTEAFLPK